MLEEIVQIAADFTSRSSFEAYFKPYDIGYGTRQENGLELVSGL
jgi:hypothetical protein